MTDKKQGGTAFPCRVLNKTPGMSLRDYFAAKAMQAIFAGEGARQVASRDGRYTEGNWSQVVALNAYEMADAMIEAREHE